MTKHFCDFCGEDNTLKPPLMKLGIFIPGDTLTPLAEELCRDCFRALKQYLKDKKKEATGI